MELEVGEDLRIDPGEGAVEGRAHLVECSLVARFRRLVRCLLRLRLSLLYPLLLPLVVASPFLLQDSGAGAEGVEVDASAPHFLAVAAGPFDGAALPVLIADHTGALAGFLLLVVADARPVAVVQRGGASLRPGDDVIVLADVRVAVGTAAGLVGQPQEAGEGG